MLSAALLIGLKFPDLLMKGSDSSPKLTMALPTHDLIKCLFLIGHGCSLHSKISITNEQWCGFEISKMFQCPKLQKVFYKFLGACNLVSLILW